MAQLILAVGGTGQVLLHYYCQMFALGIVREPFRAIVFDTDEYSKSLRTFQNYFNALRLAGCPDPLPELRCAQIEGGGGWGARIHDVMEARDLPETGYHHPLQAFYNRELLGIQASEGLYSRPAASALVVPDISDVILETDIGNDTDVLLVTSTIGGTGAGLSLQLLCRAQALGRGRLEARLKAVLLGEYFVPDERKLEKASIRFRSNKTWFLKSLEHAVPDLLRFAWLDPDSDADKLASRDANAELDAPNLPWGSERQAFWQGLKAMLFLMQDRTTEARVSLAEREVPADQYASQAQRSAVEHVLRTSLGRAEALVRQNALNRMTIEALPRRVWGNDMAAMVRRYKLALDHGSRGVVSEAGRFCAATQREMKRWWSEGQAGLFPLAGLLPAVPAHPASVKSVRKVAWTPPPADFSSEAFNSLESAGRVTAAALLDCALRKGGVA